MSIRQAFKEAVASIVGNKMRSFLTMLGMIIGVASVIILISLMQGVTGYITDQFMQGGTNLVQVVLPMRTDNKRVTEKDIYDFVDENSDLFSGVSPQISAPMNVVANGEKIENYSVTAVSEEYVTFATLKIGEGRDLQYADVEYRGKVCIIGTYIQNKFFEEGTSPIGQSLKLNGVDYIVVGVLEETNDGKKDTNDDAIFAPYTTVTKQNQIGRINNYILAATTTEKAEEAGTALKQYLYKIYQDEDMYQVVTMSEMLDMVDSILGTLTSVLAGIAAISLLVAGIGIMNIMLVSVTERTKEIGIRKSMGAKKRDIRSQFVIEAGVTSGLGGAIGIALGAAGTIIVGNLVNINATPTLGAVSISFGVSVAIGIIFGYMPANNAAKLNPIDALRDE